MPFGCADAFGGAQNQCGDGSAIVKFMSVTRRRLNGVQTLQFLSMALPGVALLALFSYLPLVGMIIAFKEYRPIDGLFGSAWIGFKNFEFLFGSASTWRITWNTLFLNGLFIVTSTLAALSLAILINEAQSRSRAGRLLSSFYQSALFFPFFISYVIVSYFMFALLDADSGMFNRILISVGAQPINWYASPQYWTVILVVINLWKGVGFSVIIYLSGLLAIDATYYEAAEIDGASKWQQIRFITLPFLMPLVTMTVLLAIGRIFFADFGLFYFVPRDQSLLYPTTDVVDTFVFRALRNLGDFGMAGAAAFYQSLVGFVLIVLANWVVRWRDPDRALF
jgi:putative aldouronate transport system permease protein